MKDKTLQELIEAEAESYYCFEPNSLSHTLTDNELTQLGKQDFTKGAHFAIPLANDRMAREVLDYVRTLVNDYQMAGGVDHGLVYCHNHLEEILAPYLITEKAE